jgi:hypothetical protein
MNIEGADFLVLSGINQNKPDALLVSQRASCSENYYEAYGFWKDQSSLQQYDFIHEYTYDRLGGRIKKLHDGNLIMEITGKHKTSQFTLSFSESSGKILLKPLRQSN